MKEMIEPELLMMLEKNTTVGKWKRYEEYKDSGIGWLGKTPGHWGTRKIKYLASLETRKFFEKPEYLLYIGLEHIESETGKLIQTTVIEDVESAMNYFPQNSVLFGKLRPYLAKVLFADFEGVCTTELLVFRPCDQLYGKYLYYKLISNDFIKLVTSLTYGTKMPRASSEQICNIPIQLPPYSEQQAIVTFLDHEITKINDLIAKRERMIALLQEQRTAIINRAITKGLYPDVAMKDSGVEWLGEIPAHWEVRKLKYIANFSGGGTPPKAIEEYWTGNIPWVSPKDMKSEIILDTEDHISEEAIENSTTNLVPSNTVLLVVRSGILRHSIPVALTSRPVTINQDIKAIITKNMLLPRYLVSLIQSHQEILLMEWRKSGATVESIEHELLINTPIPIPPLEEQKQALAFIERKVVPISKLISVIEEAIKKLKEYNTALISAAVTGKIDVRGEVAAIHTEEAAL